MSASIPEVVFKKSNNPIAGKWVCFVCRGKERMPNGSVPPMRTLEARRAGRFGGKGKVVAQATVCQVCYDKGNTHIPFGDFNGYMRAPTQDEIMGWLKQQKAEYEKKVTESAKTSPPSTDPTSPAPSSDLPSK